MKRALAVIGANFGDEGKGLTTDYLCMEEDVGMVVRFNGGAQAGHTVVTPGGKRHVFGHVGSGAFLGVPTFLSQFFILNPLLFFKELDALHALDVNPVVYAHPSCLVTTFADMIINQRIEEKRGAGRHGSVGVGVNETWERSQLPHLKITMSDLWNQAPLKDKLVEICGKYAAFRTGSKIEDAEAMIDAFIRGCDKFANAVHPLGIAQCPNPLFEGAQGLLLDQGNKEFFPHVTRSHTGMHNVRILCDHAKVDLIEAYYVSRTYVTRHGAGPLPREDPKMRYEDNTNVDHPFQGSLRFAPLHFNEMVGRIALDAVGTDTCAKIVLTHCDQFDIGGGHLQSYGPTRNDVKLMKS